MICRIRFLCLKVSTNIPNIVERILHRPDTIAVRLVAGFAQGNHALG